MDPSQETKLNNQLLNADIPEEVLMSLPSLDEIERKAARDSIQGSIEDGNYIPEGEQKLAEKDRDVRRVVCLDSQTGKPLWKRPQDLTGSGGTKLGLAYQDNKLLFFGPWTKYTNSIRNPKARAGCAHIG